MTEETLFEHARKIPAGERSAFLDQHCAGQPELRARIEALLAADAATRLPIDQPAAVFEPTGRFPLQADEQPTLAPEAPQLHWQSPAGTVIAGKYHLVDVIGEGGMGSVFRARQTEPVKRFVALKLIKAGMDSRQVLARFEAERQALALMDHPHIAKVLDGGLHEHRPFFVMELVKGVPITQYCDINRLSPNERLELFVQACQAIQHAHQKGIIHRDIKPSNVLVALYDDKPMVKVIDFGVAKATGGTLTEATLDTGFGGVVGTPQYMSPEQATFNNLDIDTRSDVYALGVLLYELLTGSPPFSAEELQKKGLFEILRVVREEEPPRPSTRLSTAEALPSLSANRGTEPKKLTGLLRNELDWIVMKALEKDRVRRYETANGLAADVMRYLAGEPVQAHPPGRAYRLRKFVRRNRPQVITASLVLLALVAGVVGTTMGLVEARRQAGIARNEALAAEAARAEEERQRTIAEANQRKAVAAARQERLAKQREARRAEAEKAARMAQEQERQFAEAITAFVRDDFLALTSVEGQDRFGGEGLNRTATLVELLNRAADKLNARTDLQPRIEAELCWIVGVNYRGLGEAAKGVPFLERAVALRTQAFGADHQSTLVAANSLSTCLASAGKFGQALPLFEETLRLRRAKLGPEHFDTLNSMNNLAGCYRAVGKLDQALALDEETLRLRREKLGPDHPDTLASMNNLAACYRDAGKFDQALPLFENTLKLRKEKLGPEHSSTLASMNNLAGCYYAVRQFDRAIGLYEETLRLKRLKLGPDHPNTLTLMNNLAAAYEAAGRLDLALPLHEETLNARKSKLGPEHPDTLTSMNNLATGYHTAGKLDLALPLFEETLRLTKAALGPDHPDTLGSIDNLAVVYQNAGKPNLALPLYEEALALKKTKWGLEHPSTVASMNSLASGYHALGRLDQALPLYEEALRLRTTILGPDHPDALDTMARLGAAYCDARKGENASRTMATLVDGMRKLYPKEHPEFAGVLARVSHKLLQCGQFATAETFLRECLAIRNKLEGDAWTTFNTQSLLGGALLGQKKYADAEQFLLRGFEGMKAREEAIPQPAKENIPAALDRLIQFYAETNKPDEAMQYRVFREAYSSVKEAAPAVKK